MKTMTKNHFIIIGIVFALCAPILTYTQEKPDLVTVAKIRHEGFKHSQVMNLVGYLSDVIGPRPTGSPEVARAYDWTSAKFREWGCENVDLEPFYFGIGWAPRYVSAHLFKPHYAPLIAISVEWGSSTNGKITGQPVFVTINNKDDFEKYKGKLNGKIVLYMPPRETPTSFTPDARRYDQSSLDERAVYPIAAEERDWQDYVRGFADELEDFFRSEGIGVLVRPSSTRSRNFGTVHAEGIRSARFPDRLRPLPEIILAAEHYNRIHRILVEYKEPIEMEVEVRNEFYAEDLNGYNVVAEIPGTDKKDEIVILGGHIDSWSPGTGAADNAAGCAVCMEAVRILQTLGLKPRRTIRVVLWGAEEKGWVGSKSYVAQHFGDVETMTLKPEQAKVCAYYNYDNGSGKIRGIHLQENIQLKPIFEEWIKPFTDLGMTHVVTRATGGSDHGALDYIGIPSFQFIQDPLDYGTRIHHTNMDVYDHLIAEDLIQSAVIMATFVYNTAMLEGMFPRKPLYDPFKYPVRR
jgi:carboxypeptidase Q